MSCKNVLNGASCCSLCQLTRLLVFAQNSWISIVVWVQPLIKPRVSNFQVRGRRGICCPCHLTEGLTTITSGVRLRHTDIWLWATWGQFVHLTIFSPRAGSLRPLHYTIAYSHNVVLAKYHVNVHIRVSFS